VPALSGSQPPLIRRSANKAKSSVSFGLMALVLSGTAFDSESIFGPCRWSYAQQQQWGPKIRCRDAHFRRGLSSLSFGHSFFLVSSLSFFIAYFLAFEKPPGWLKTRNNRRPLRERPANTCISVTSTDAF